MGTQALGTGAFWGPRGRGCTSGRPHGPWDGFGTLGDSCRPPYLCKLMFYVPTRVRRRALGRGVLLRHLHKHKRLMRLRSPLNVLCSATPGSGWHAFRQAGTADRGNPEGLRPPGSGRELSPKNATSSSLKTGIEVPVPCLTPYPTGCLPGKVAGQQG